MNLDLLPPVAAGHDIPAGAVPPVAPGVGTGQTRFPLAFSRSLIGSPVVATHAMGAFTSYDAEIAIQPKINEIILALERATTRQEGEAIIEGGLGDLTWQRNFGGAKWTLQDEIEAEQQVRDHFALLGLPDASAQGDTVPEAAGSADGTTQANMVVGEEVFRRLLAGRTQKKGMGTGTKIAIGLGLAAAVAAGAWLLARRRSPFGMGGPVAIRF